MQLSPLHIILICFVALLLTMCKDDDTILTYPLGNTAGTCDLMLDPFLLNPENEELSSYNDYSEALFMNASGDQTTFQISQALRTIDEGVFEGSDSLRYCYSTEIVETTLLDENGIQFTIIVETKPNFVDLALGEAADVLKLFYNNTMTQETDRRLVFRKVLDIKNYPAGLYLTTEVLASMFFIDQDFKSVEITNFNSPIVTVYYSDLVGIVAFVDEANVLWQYSAKL